MTSGIMENGAKRHGPAPYGRGKIWISAGSQGEMIFERVKLKLKAKLGSEVYSSWFGRLKLDETSKSIVRLSVPTAFLRSWINNHYSDMIAALWREEDEQTLKVEIVFRSASRCRPAGSAMRKSTLRADTRALIREKPVFPVGNTAQDKKAPAHFADRAQNSVFGSPLDPRYTFDTFVDGTPNRVALAAARTIADAGASAVRFNPLFIHASVGLGKTHLLAGNRRRSVEASRACPCRLSHRRIFHVALCNRHPRQQCVVVQGTAARHRSADHRRHAVSAGQVDPA